MRRGLAVLALVSVLIAGCGGSETNEPTEEQEIAQRVNAFVAAWSAGDGEAACSYLSAHGQSAIARALANTDEFPGLTASTPCEEAVERSAKTAKSGGMRVSAGQVTINGDGTAVVTNRFGAELTLVNREGEWFIDIPVFAS